MKFFKLLFFCLSIILVDAQNAPQLSIVHGDRIVDYGGDLSLSKCTVDADGNIYVVGNFMFLADFDPSVSAYELDSPSRVTKSLFIAKYDAQGNFIWAKKIEGLESTITCTSIIVGGNNLYIAGKFDKTVDFDPSTSENSLTSPDGTSAPFIVKFDLNGTFMLVKKFEGNPSSTNASIDIMSYANNQLVIGGFFSDIFDANPSQGVLNLTSAGMGDFFVAKFDSNVDVQWAFGIGGVSNDYVLSIDINSANDIYICGNYSYTVDFDPSPATQSLSHTAAGHSFSYIAKYNSNGAFLWVKDLQAENSLSSGNRNNVELALDANENIVIVGQFNFPSDFDPSAATSILTPNNGSVFIGKYDANGNYLWVKLLPDCTLADFSMNASNGKIAIVGTFSTNNDFDPTSEGQVNLDVANGTYYAAIFDSNGAYISAANTNVNFSNILPSDADQVQILGVFNGKINFDMSGGTFYAYSYNRNIFMARYTNTLALDSYKQIGGNKPKDSVTNFIGSDQQNNIYRGGDVSAPSDIDPSTNVFEIASINSPGGFVAKYDSSGNFVWAKTFHGDDFFVLTSFGVDANGNTYVAGRFKGTVDFDPSNNDYYISTGDNVSLFIAKFDTNGNFVWAKQIVGGISAAKKIVFDNAGNFYFTGRYNNRQSATIDVDPSPTATLIITPNSNVLTYIGKYNPQGELVWFRNFEAVQPYGASMNESDIHLTGNEIYTSGKFTGQAYMGVNSYMIEGGAAYTSGYIAKYDLEGNCLFAYAYKNDDANSDTYYITSINCHTITTDANLNVYTISRFKGGVKLDVNNPSGALTTAPLLSINDTVYSTVICKYDPNMMLLWAKQFDSADQYSWFNEFGLCHVVNNEVLFVGNFAGIIDVDPGSGTLYTNSLADNSGYHTNNSLFAKYDSTTGNLIRADKINSSNNCILNMATVGQQDTIYVSGWNLGTSDFTLGNDVPNATSTIDYYGRFWAKYGANSLDSANFTDSFTPTYIYPNPTQTRLFVNGLMKTEAQYDIVDLSGKKIVEKQNLPTDGIDVYALPQGAYIINIQSEKGVQHHKFIKN